MRSLLFKIFIILLLSTNFVNASLVSKNYTDIVSKEIKAILNDKKMVYTIDFVIATREGKIATFFIKELEANNGSVKKFKSILSKYSKWTVSKSKKMPPILTIRISSLDNEKVKNKLLEISSEGIYIEYIDYLKNKYKLSNSSIEKIIKSNKKAFHPLMVKLLYANYKDKSKVDYFYDIIIKRFESISFSKIDKIILNYISIKYNLTGLNNVSINLDFCLSLDKNLAKVCKKSIK